jgi:phosphoheptose isomerase
VFARQIEALGDRAMLRSASVNKSPNVLQALETANAAS